MTIRDSCCRLLHTTTRSLSHENPLGLPRAQRTPPNLAARMTRNLPTKRRIDGVSRVVAISSAKGGVGKSTVAANIAASIAQQGRRAGLLDADIFGPSVPTIFNLADAGEPQLGADNRLIPLTNYGVKTMSMGYLLADERNAVAWRGLMLQKALQQLLHEVDWGGLDVLVIDMPPGTGDTQLTVAQQVQLDGAVVVSTPQMLALKDAVKGVTMFEKMDVRLLGLVQNMSGYVCPKCGEVSEIFGGQGKVRQECDRLGVELLADIPLDLRICEDADAGMPTVVKSPEGEQAKAFGRLATRILEMVEI